MSNLQTEALRRITKSMDIQKQSNTHLKTSYVLWFAASDVQDVKIILRILQIWAVHNIYQNPENVNESLC